MNQTVPKKHLGQHWLQDKFYLQTIVQAAYVKPGDDVLEIGPGLGTLTKELLAAGANVYAVEFDSALAKKLQSRFGSNLNFKIYEQDILKFDFDSLPANYKVVANIPYYLTSNLLKILCEATNHFSTAALLVQKEVAERVCAKPGKMSILSVSVQLYCDVSLGQIVPADLFTPPPKVDSQILQLEHIGDPRFNVDLKKFFRVVKAGFSERRKMLRSTISSGLNIPKIEAEEIIMKAGIDPSLRAQALSLEEWHKLYLELK